ncbi:MAG: STAS/SEC14 domain-containing protein [Desulfovibrionales bacterium]|nr:STAS/SEC14 domain-containing protein [Desulfovibrionales bacterium]
MLELLDGFDETTIALRGSGEITREDYQTVLIPRAKKLLETYEKVNCFMHITEGATYTMGALAADATFGLGHIFSWNKVAIVSDIHWIHRAAGYILPLMPFHVRLYAESDYDDAKQWLME